MGGRTKAYRAVSIHAPVRGATLQQLRDKFEKLERMLRIAQLTKKVQIHRAGVAEQRIRTLEEALQFYAAFTTDIDDDMGARAKQALGVGK